MKHFTILLVVALVTLSIMFLIYRPDLLEDIWLWLIGLIGPIIGTIQEVIKRATAFFKKFNLDSE